MLCQSAYEDLSQDLWSNGKKGKSPLIIVVDMVFIVLV